MFLLRLTFYFFPRTPNFQREAKRGLQTKNSDVSCYHLHDDISAQKV